ncbi:aminoglycoside phosphotransferase family protein [Roseovarius arcticus]|uniref:aminoglycoside phosphotransferase family protein n=1 Tax=Roseovarius arcticus TaxID=2547404 RepID=UPI0011107267|nr:phosphotransferase [Roseovarius arcticus]
MTAAPATTLSTTSAAFLASEGYGGAILTPFTADASPRRYHRLEGCGLILMEDPTDPVGYAAYLRLSAHLNQLGLSAPRVLANDPENGLALIEDLGDATYAQCLRTGEDEHALYCLAVDALLHLHHDPRSAEVVQPLYDLDTHLNELAIFAEWFAPAIAPGLSDDFARDWRARWQGALAPIAERHDTLVMRDFHVDNLLLLSARSGVARCGLLDFQDAVIGPCEYDLMSLLQDARRDLAPGLEDEMLARYIENAPAGLGNAADIRQRYHILAAQRHARILGVFVRLDRLNGKQAYLKWIPRVAEQLRTALEAAQLRDITALLETHLPDWQAAAARITSTQHTERAC